MQELKGKKKQLRFNFIEIVIIIIQCHTDQRVFDHKFYKKTQTIYTNNYSILSEHKPMVDGKRTLILNHNPKTPT